MRKSCTTHYAFKPRIIVPKRPSRDLEEVLVVPVKGNRILLFAKYVGYLNGSYLHLSIHKIRSDRRVDPGLWSFYGSGNYHLNIFKLMPIKSTENELGITFGVRFIGYWKVFNISTDASDNSPLIESGRINYGLKLKASEWVGVENSLGLSQIFM